VIEFRRAVSRCGFLLDWQKEKLIGMLDEVDGVDGEEDGISNGHIYAVDVFPVLDNVMWRTMGIGLDSLPALDRLNIEQAVREVAY